MPTLLELDLSRNCLLSIPDALFKTLVNLQILDLSYNSLLQLPDSIIGLKMLRQLNILHNSLVELPLLIGQLQELEEINLGFNVFTDSLRRKVKNDAKRCDYATKTSVRFAANRQSA
ncbi:unnamed protein product [Aphanomyces euteiches]